MADLTPEQEDKEQAKPSDEQAFIAQARKRFERAAEAESRMRREALEDLKFVEGDQWISENYTQRNDIEKRPCLVINRIAQDVRIVSNGLRQNNPALRVLPVDDNADIETARVFQGLFRHIERNSDASQARGIATDSQVAGGFGYYRIVTDFLDDKSFDQEIFLRPIVNPFCVYLDPGAQELDASDGMFAFVVADVPRATYAEEYPNAEVKSAEELTSIGDVAPGWVTTDSVKVAEYFYVENQRRVLCQMPDGKPYYKDVLQQQGEAGKQLLKLVTRERDVYQRVVKVCKINGKEILEKESLWPGKWIPIIRVLGMTRIVDGEKRISGLVRHAKDSQRMINYAASYEAEALMFNPRPTYVIAEGQVGNHAEQWKKSTNPREGALVYKETDVAGQPVPPPRRENSEPPISGIAQVRTLAVDDLKNTIGLGDPARGSISSERSGAAIRALQEKGNLGTFHFSDNRSHAMRFEGKQLLDLIPKIYDRPGRVLRIIGEDNTPQTVAVGKPGETPIPDGVKAIYDLSVGTYDVVVDVGPDYSTKRQEALDSLAQLGTNAPSLAPLTAIYIAKNSDWDHSQEFAKRAEKLLPPELQEQTNEADPQALQSQIQALTQHVNDLSSALDKASEEIRTKTLEIEGRKEIEAMKARVNLAIAEIGARSKEGMSISKENIAVYQSQIDALEAELDRLSANLASVQPPQPSATTAASPPQ